MLISCFDCYQPRVAEIISTVSYLISAILRDTLITIIMNISCHFHDFQIIPFIRVNTLQVFFSVNVLFVISQELNLIHDFYLMLTDEYVICTSCKPFNTLFKSKSRLNIIRCLVCGCLRVVDAIQFGFRAITSRKKHR